MTQCIAQSKTADNTPILPTFKGNGGKEATSQFGRRRERAHRPWTVIPTGTARLVVAVAFALSSSGTNAMLRGSQQLDQTYSRGDYPTEHATIFQEGGSDD